MRRHPDARPALRAPRKKCVGYQELARLARLENNPLILKHVDKSNLRRRYVADLRPSRVHGLRINNRSAARTVAQKS